MRTARLSTFVAAICCALLLPGATAHAQAARTSIRKVDLSAFPKVTATVTLPQSFDPDHDSVTVTENDAVITTAAVESLFGSGEHVEVVLAIDSSGSMAGTPMEQAIAAAKEFVSDLPDDIAVGVLSFATSPRVLVPVTRDHGRALATLDTITAAGETALFDGVIAAAGMFGAEGQHNIVLLSDGGDTVSKGNLGAAVQASTKAEAAVFAVGLTTPETDVASLRTLGARSGGRYAPAAGADLSAVYGDLATELQQQYLVSYRSPAASGDELLLTVSAAGAHDSVLLLAPEVEPVAPAPPAPRPVPEPDPLLEGDAGLLVALGTTFTAVFGLALVFLGAGTRAARARRLRRVVSATGERPRLPDDEAGTQWLPRALVNLSEHAAELTGVSAGINATLERANIALRGGELLALCGIAAIGGALLGLLSGSPLLALLLGSVGALGPYAWAKTLAGRRLTRIHEQLPDILMVLASSLRSGHSFFQALDAVAREIGEPGASEFARVVTEIRLGRSIDTAMNDLAERVESEDFKWAVLAVNIQRDVGGNLAEVLDTVSDTMRERQVMRRQVRVLSAEGRISIYILLALPFLLAGYMAFVNLPYLSLLWTTRMGIVMLGGAAALMSLGVIWMRKVVKIDV